MIDNLKLTVQGAQQRAQIHEVEILVVSKEVSDATDELEFATNWRRGFTTLYTKLKWLKAFTKINKVAVNRMKEKFASIYFENSDNVIDKIFDKIIER